MPLRRPALPASHADLRDRMVGAAGGCFSRSGEPQVAACEPDIEAAHEKDGLVDRERNAPGDAARAHPATKESQHDHGSNDPADGAVKSVERY